MPGLLLQQGGHFITEAPWREDGDRTGYDWNLQEQGPVWRENECCLEPQGFLVHVLPWSAFLLVALMWTLKAHITSASDRAGREYNGTRAWSSPIDWRQVEAEEVWDSEGFWTCITLSPSEQSQHGCLVMVHRLHGFNTCQQDCEGINISK